MMMLTSLLTSSAKSQLNRRGGTSLLLNSPAMSFARYFNRA